MARKKKSVTSDINIELNDNNTDELMHDVVKLLNEQLTEKYGEYEDPEILIVKTDVRPLDAILGGGLVLGMPVMVTGAAEIGKTTIAWQLIKSLFTQYPTSIALYIDIEGSANIKNEDLGIKSRIELMNIDSNRVIYKSATMSIEKTFELIDDTIKFKRKIEEKINKQIPIIIVWDSIADTDPGKIEDVDNPNSLTGFKSRLIQFLLGKYKPLFRRNQAMLYLIDQVRANISDSMNMPYAKKVEKQVGQLNNLKSATASSTAVSHKLRQWLFLSQGPEIFDKPGILGWYLDIHVVKSKLSPSGFSVRVVFDKRYGIDKFWSEYYFISNLMPFEEKIYKKLGGSQNSKANQYKKNIELILGIKTKGSYKSLEYIDPETGEVEQYSKSFYEKDAKILYETDELFRKIFDKVVNLNIQERIIKLFNPTTNQYEMNIKEILKDEEDIDVLVQENTTDV